MALSIRSPAFEDGGEIPLRHTADGENLSPPLAWSGAPAGTETLALIVDDPDAPDPSAPKRTFVHWVVYDLPAGAESLPEAVRPGDLPGRAREGKNDWGAVGYGGPKPPIGRHRYVHKLYALDARLPAGEPLTKAELERAMKGHVLAQAQLVGTYASKRGAARRRVA